MRFAYPAARFVRGVFAGAVIVAAVTAAGDPHPLDRAARIDRAVSVTAYWGAASTDAGRYW